MCEFCRTPPHSSDEEYMERVEKLMDNGNAEAFYVHASDYAQGLRGIPQDWSKANELFLKAGELGCAAAYYNLANHYYNGDGVDVDKKKAKHYWELAAMKGDVHARYSLGMLEGQAGNEQRAYKHMIIAAKSGCKDSLDIIKRGFIDGFITKDEYAQALRACHEQQVEMKSEARDKAAE